MTGRPGSITVGEIRQQPPAWRELLAPDRTALDDFLAVPLDRPDLRVILTGAGSSALAGRIAASAVQRRLGRRVDAVATTDIVARPDDHLEPTTPTLLVSFARSGNSPESVATTRLADELITDVWHLILTCDAQGTLAQEHAARRASYVWCMPEQTNDAGFAMTSSLTSMLVSCLSALGPLTTDHVAPLTRAADQVIALQPEIAALGPQPLTRVVHLGSGPLLALAQEAALKLLELTAGAVVTYADTPLGFRHGPKAVLDALTHVIVYVSTDPYARRYDLDIIAELRAQLGPEAVTVLAAEPIPHGPATILAGLERSDDAIIAVAYLVFAQLLAFSASIAHGHDPDNPFPAGEVNRVVQGVTIHPRTATP